jgi:hypothetical protein
VIVNAIPVIWSKITNALLSRWYLDCDGIETVAVAVSVVADGFDIAVAVVIGAAAFDNAAVPVVVAVESMVDCGIARGTDSNLEDALSLVTWAAWREPINVDVDFFRALFLFPITIDPSNVSLLACISISCAEIYAHF